MPTSPGTSRETRSLAGAVRTTWLWLPFICSLGYGSIFWWRPLWLLKLDDRLRSKGIPVPLAHHPHVLDAWVEIHQASVGRWFESEQSIVRASDYIPIPVTLDGKEIAELTPRDLQRIFARSGGFISIVGEGGAGKTALAAQMGRWASHADPQTRSSSHRMLPIWFDEKSEGDRSPIDEICDRLQGATAEAISPKLVESLLRRCRILLVSDGVSQIEESRQFSMMRVVTSRSLAAVEKFSTTCIELLPLRGYSLASFIESYLQELQKRHLFDDEEFFEICQHLCSFVGDRQITPLYAKLYTDCVIAHRERQTVDRKPENIPDLMLDYLDRRDGQCESPQHWPHSTLHRRVEALAWECLKQTYQPTFVAERDAIAALAQCNGGNEQRAKAFLEYLIQDLVLLERRPKTGKVGFICSPLAEYLAGLYIVDRYGEDEAAWREFLDTVKHREGNPGEIRDFLLAARDCAIVRQAKIDLPQWLPKRLGERAGLDPTLLRTAQLKHHIRELIAQLALPDTRLRQLAADRLGQMGARAGAAVSALMEALDDEDERVRIQSSVALGNIGVEAIPALVNAFKKDNKEVRSGAAFALERMGAVAIPGLVAALKLEDSDVLSGTVFALERMGTTAIPTLIEALKKGDNNVRVLAAIVLGRIGSPAVEALVEAFQTGNAAVRHHAANALGSMGAEASAAVPAFEAALLDRDKEVRSSAVFVLERIGAAAVTALQKALAHEDWLVRRNAADALGRIGTQAKATIPDLEKACGDRDRYVREAAVEALRLIQVPHREEA
ncbi:HEAT repeat domain-containing protein [Oscillatoriales cyanobacterium LEGE 11467]|uniref:HEAT repeat domain-containing protein n=1 Tax=Zarconia navalis LEGE 11467 TaxID=1828826 RepID=A0A928VV19_9CYAN|nr:HEAT repeat domain-containing protein [Zarconia navalis]MBE9040864.1 HEAT repeat domain-containing protein [Zarconia navalis LEGE 11467]